MDFNVPEHDDPDGSMRMHVEAGYQSAQSTPLVARSGRPIGMVTTHWRKQHRPQDRELRFLDLLVRQAADLIEQRQADEALRKSRQDLAMELADTKKLQVISSQLILEDNVDALYQQILEAALSLTHSEMGSIHMFHAEKNQLRLLTEKGLDPDAVNFLGWVPVDSSSFCGMALAKAERIIVPDLDESGFMSGKEDLDFYRSSGVRASQSTPLISRGGRIVGVLSTHWREPYHPSERELRLLEVLVRQAADLIERKRTEEALRESDRRKDEFLATLAHELRNPLAPIKNGVRIAHLTIPADSPLTPTLGIIDRQLDHLVHLVDDLLDVARISSGKLELRKERVALREALARGIECMQSLIDGHRHELIVDISPDELFVEGDLDRLSQIFANLLSNAAKYTEEKGRISVTMAREGDEAVVRVTDTGVGIDADDLKRVFDLFSQVTSSHRLTEGGLGIGLSLIRTLVHLHGGTITAESSGSKTGGSTFIVRLPLSHPDAMPAPGPQPSSVHKNETLSLRILVVDDNVDAGTILGMLLEMDGHEVEVVHNGKDAVKKAGNDPPDLIFLDLGMPEMDGVETARHLRALPGGNGIFLVALTGWGQEKDRQRTREAGFDAHLVKPVDNAALAEVLERANR
jgi:signal transduction histidine kinase/CheY-like chemotaxis protein